MTTPLQELIERLEKATGPDRDLDAEIHCLLNGWEKGIYGFPEAKPYTHSIDAALTLVPEGFTWKLENTQPISSYALAIVAKPIGTTAFPTKTRWHAPACTPAIALTIASLRARQST